MIEKIFIPLIGTINSFTFFIIFLSLSSLQISIAIKKIVRLTLALL